MEGKQPDAARGGRLDLSGVVPPTLTAFDDDGTIDDAATAAHAQFVQERGADAVFPLGTNGEFAMLTAGERRRVIETVAGTVSIPVIAGVGCPSTQATVAQAEYAEAAGVDGVVVVTPYYYPVDGDGLFEHYRSVADAVDVPVYIYHIPSKTGTELPLETLDRLASVAGIAGLKDSSKDVPWLTQAIDRNAELTYLIGSDSLLLVGLKVGCSGVVSAVANVFPELVVDLYEAYDAGEESRAHDIQSLVFDVRSALKSGPYMSGVKAAFSIREEGFDMGGLRSPLRTMDESDRAALEGKLTELGVL